LQITAVHENENKQTNKQKITLTCRVQRNYQQFSRNAGSCREVPNGCIFTMRAVKPRNPLEGFKTRPDKVLNNLACPHNSSCFKQDIELSDLLRSLPT